MENEIVLNTHGNEKEQEQYEPNKYLVAKEKMLKLCEKIDWILDMKENEEKETKRRENLSDEDLEKENRHLQSLINLIFVIFDLCAYHRI